MKKTRSALAIAAILVVAGCSSTSDTDTGAPTTETPLSTTTTAVTTTVAEPSVTTTVAEPSVTTTTRAPDSTTSVPVTTTVVEPSVTTTTRAPDSTTSVPVTTSIPSTVEVLVYLLGGPNADPENYECSAVSPVVRSVRPPALLSAAFEALLSGPTDEEREAGYDSWFSSDTGWTLRSVTIVDGVAWIDFSEDSPLINNASTSCGSAGFLAQLDSTATQFSTVDRAIYSFGGDPVPFYEWLQRDPPEA